MTDFHLFGSEIITLEQWRVREHAAWTGRSRSTHPGQTTGHRRTPEDQTDSTSDTASLRSTTSIAGARNSTRAFLEGLAPALPPETTDTAILVVPEPVTNALRHSGTCTLDLTAHHDSIEVAVRDPSPQAPRMRTPDLNGGTGDFD